MDWILFTPAFRAKLRHLASCSKGNKARALAAKVSAFPSAFATIVLLQFVPDRGYDFLATMSLAFIGAGMAVAYAVPSPFLRLLHLLATDFNHVVLWDKSSERSRDKG
ncbi:hypothetical protein [Variovorax sp. RA8]|uniref:hypothetical protein n=1 Tax=Variovorax sp. (strain JCM 16519 / RA8) TaxID=662548 RepID=UPI000ABBE7BC|nr:hypothetical protein [Variovorax sp. RA8]VTU42990.1 hypothetical protein RA8P1_00372 [Variovorax sp. RA8]